jgi:hypothetical protein
MGICVTLGISHPGKNQDKYFLLRAGLRPASKKQKQAKNQITKQSILQNAPEVNDLGKHRTG